MSFFSLRLPLLLLLPCLAAAHAADLYKCKGENGETVFSDQPCKGGETLPMRETPTYAAPPNPASLLPPKPQSKRADDLKYVVTLTQPAADEVIRDNEGRVNVEGTVKPALYEDHRVRLLLDGVVAGEAKSTAGWSLSDVPRGEHSLVIEVVHKSTGKVLNSSAASKFALFRASGGQAPDGAARLNWPRLGDALQPGDTPPTPPTKPINTGPRK